MNVEVWYFMSAYDIEPREVRVKTISTGFFTREGSSRREARDSQSGWLRPTRKEAFLAVAEYWKEQAEREISILSAYRIREREALNGAERESK